MKQILTLLLTILMFGCGEYSEKPATTDAQENQKHTPTNRVAIPLAVRENLGITSHITHFNSYKRYNNFT